MALSIEDPASVWGNQNFDKSSSDADFVELVYRPGQIIGIGLCSEEDSFFFSNLYMLWGSFDSDDQAQHVYKMQEHGNYSPNCQEMLLNKDESFTDILLTASDDRIFAFGLATDSGRQIFVGDPDIT